MAGIHRVLGVDPAGHGEVGPVLAALLVSAAIGLKGAESLIPI